MLPAILLPGAVAPEPGTAVRLETDPMTGTVYAADELGRFAKIHNQHLARNIGAGLECSAAVTNAAAVVLQVRTGWKRS